MDSEIRYYTTIFMEYIKIKFRKLKRAKNMVYISSLQTLVFQLMNLILIFTVYKNDIIINGWSQYELLFLFSYTSIILDIYYIFSGGLFTLPYMYIHRGKFDKLLAYPFNTLSLLIFENISLYRLIPLIFNIALTIIFGIMIHVKLNILSLFLMFWNIITGFLILFGLTIILTSFSFVMKTRQSPASFLTLITGFAKYPLSFFDKFIQVILTYFIPYAYISYLPISFILNKNVKINYLCISTLLAIILFLTGIILFQIFTEKYRSVGSN
ncbi:ABC-type uncharacterized transport system, permease component [Marinitoga piezophila KA3]|uniref:ABC-type uncharacterized transport system, permease component n=1 Tax=Marinitoga piezophila (strain DSM 14283 / JCM 11233 / KA3) TaxID=443254 RepID=H2J5P9_MARPK|nr:ABC-2 family transporter protein [Marinitoga piezophila]AEX85035.1 ABC-type uncharacterized transport system, permease component [Marinitoga piezophila KA3]